MELKSDDQRWLHNLEGSLHRLLEQAPKRNVLGGLNTPQDLRRGFVLRPVYPIHKGRQFQFAS
jgi:hypothetical protein